MADRRPLVITADELLLDELLRLAAAGGVEVEVAVDAASARGSWTAAPIVVVGGDALPGCVATRLPRRDGLLVVTGSEPDAPTWRQAVAVGAEQVLSLPDADSAVVRRLAESIETDSAAHGLVLCCIGGCGGAGASVLAAALARTAARDLRRSTLLVDLDPFSGGLDLALGGEGAGGLRWPELGATSGRVSAAALREALPTIAGVTVLSAGRDQTEEISAETVQAVLAAGRRAGDIVVADLPRASSAAAGIAAGTADRVWLVVPAEVRAVAAAASTATRLAGWTDRTEVVVREIARSSLSAELIARTLRLPLAGSARTESGLVAALDRGEPPAGRPRGPLATLCRALLADVTGRRGRHHELRDVA
ncbi:MAG TPA: septum site-determining protein Ssd [Mycobacteriales bacterium]|nr:septum site-determining protein Ssd [Mycobacteriales bacterium]